VIDPVIDLAWHEELGTDAARLHQLLLAVRAEDGRPDVVKGGPLPSEFRGGWHLLARDGGALVGYAHLDPAGDSFGRQIGELLVHPAHRGHGVGLRLLRALIDRAIPGADLADDADTPERLRIWSHVDHPAAARLARRCGLRRVRELLRMRLDFEGAPALPEPRWRGGVRVRAFVPGRDEDAVIEVNRRAFSWHPEQGGLTVEELTASEAQPWFDPAGFFLAVDEHDRVLGFHWTKVHPEGFGEVYVVGVDPDAQGGGLGKALTLAGLHHLRDRGIDQVILYVEADNAPAVAVYSGLGFRRWDVGVQYGK
jgi:mycothiol synthase